MAGMIKMPGMGGPMGPRKKMFQIQFEKYDTDQSGSISFQEFKAMCFDMGYQLTDEELDIATKQLDVDQSGGIEVGEFETWWNQDQRFEHLQVRAWRYPVGWPGLDLPRL